MGYENSKYIRLEVSHDANQCYDVSKGGTAPVT